MNKRRFSVFFVLILSIFLVSCAPSTETADNNQINNSSGVPDDEQITITWWDYNSHEGRNDAINMIISEYEEDNPNVKIERTYVPFGELKNKLLMGAAAGELPDIVWIDNPDHQSFAAAGVLADLTEYIEEWGEADQYFEGPWSSTMYEGRNYGIPNSSNNLALFYNTDMLNEAGLDPPTNWEELKDAAGKLTTDDVYGFGVSGVNHEQTTFHFLPFVWQAGSDLDNFNSEGTVEAMNLWKEMYDKGYMPQEMTSLDQNDINLQFIAGNVAMMVNGTWQLDPLSEADINWDVVPLPEYKQQSTILGGENWAVTSSSEHVDVAWDIIKFSQEPERLTEFLKLGVRIPSRQDIIDDPYWQEDPHLKVFLEGMEGAKARAYGPEYPEISTTIQNMIQDVLTEAKTTEEAVEEADTIIQELLP